MGAVRSEELLLGLEEEYGHYGTHLLNRIRFAVPAGGSSRVGQSLNFYDDVVAIVTGHRELARFHPAAGIKPPGASPARARSAQ